MIKPSADCFYRWWPDHGIDRLVDALEEEADKLTCYASTMKEHRPNYAAMLMRDAVRALAFYEQNAATQGNATCGSEAQGQRSGKSLDQHEAVPPASAAPCESYTPGLNTDRCQRCGQMHPTVSMI